MPELSRSVNVHSDCHVSDVHCLAQKIADLLFEVVVVRNRYVELAVLPKDAGALP
jgi:hypothetical protein